MPRNVIMQTKMKLVPRKKAECKKSWRHYPKLTKMALCCADGYWRTSMCGTRYCNRRSKGFYLFFRGHIIGFFRLKSLFIRDSDVRTYFAESWNSISDICPSSPCYKMNENEKADSYFKWSTKKCRQNFYNLSKAGCILLNHVDHISLAIFSSRRLKSFKLFLKNKILNSIWSSVS